MTDARPTGRWAARAVDGLAPLPQAWEAARLALDFGRRLQRKDGAAARALLSQVRESLERAVRINPEYAPARKALEGTR